MATDFIAVRVRKMSHRLPDAAGELMVGAVPLAFIGCLEHGHPAGRPGFPLGRWAFLALMRFMAAGRLSRYTGDPLEQAPSSSRWEGNLVAGLAPLTKRPAALSLIGSWRLGRLGRCLESGDQKSNVRSRKRLNIGRDSGLTFLSNKDAKNGNRSVRTAGGGRIEIKSRYLAKFCSRCVQQPPVFDQMLSP